MTNDTPEARDAAQDAEPLALRSDDLLGTALEDAADDCLSALAGVETCDVNLRDHPDAWKAIEAFAAKVRAIMAECAAMAAAREQRRHADDLRCALEALDYCIEDSAELLSERTAQWGNYRKDRQAAMAATLERHRAVVERLRRVLNGA